MRTEINNKQNVLDSRDIIEYLEELESERDELIEKLEELTEKEIDLKDEFNDAEDDHDWKERIEADLDKLNNEKENIQRDLDEFDEDGGDYAVMKSLNDEGESYFGSDWSYGVTLVLDSYFTEFAEEFCKDIGDVPTDLPAYIENNIDWEGVAEDLKADYAELDFDGVTYWAR